MSNLKSKYTELLKQTEQQLNELAIQQQRLLGCLHALEEVEAEANTADTSESKEEES